MENGYTYEKICQIIGGLVLGYTSQLEGKDKQYRELIQKLQDGNEELEKELEGLKNDRPSLPPSDGV